MNKKITLIIVLVFVCGLVYSFQKQPKTLKVGLNPWPGYSQFFIAKEKGLFSKYGLDVELEIYPALSEVLQAYENKEIDIMASTLVEVLIADTEEHDRPLIFEVADYSNGADVIIAQKKFLSLNDLKGKKIGVEINSLGMYFLYRILQEQEMILDEFNIIAIEQENAVDLFVDHELDALISYPPFVPKIAGKTDFNVIADSSDLKKEIIDVFSIRKSLYETNPDLIYTFNTVWREALGYFNDHQDEAMQIIANETGIEQEELIQIYENIEMVVDQKDHDEFFHTDLIEKDIMRTQKYLKEVGLVYQTIAAKEYFIEN